MATTADTISRIITHGPDRVVYDRQGSATNPKRAAEKGAKPDIIFVRDDGWSLGAPRRYERVAFDMWDKNWIGFIEKGEFFEMSQY